MPGVIEVERNLQKTISIPEPEKFSQNRSKYGPVMSTWKERNNFFVTMLTFS